MLPAQTKTIKNCNKCEYKKPDLLPANEDAWELFEAAGTQWRSSGFSFIGLDYTAVYQIAAVMGIDSTATLHEKVRILESITLERINKKEG
jgi:hypothetical protein